ncbi:MAG: DUF6178 family protein [Desulfatibacillaceae bacterium]
MASDKTPKTPEHPGPASGNPWNDDTLAANVPLALDHAFSHPPEQALDLIISHPLAPSLVRSMSGQDLYLLVREVGPGDSTPLMALADDEQWRYMMDMEAWRGDRFDLDAFEKWGELLYEAAPERAVRWLADQELEAVELWLHKTTQVVALAEDEPPDDLPEGFMSFDGVLYFRLLHPSAPSVDEEPGEEQPEPLERTFALDFLKHLAAVDYLHFQKMLFETQGVIAAEMEEELYRLRNVRLAEAGFAPYEEAVGVYQPLTPEQVEARGPKFPPKRREKGDGHVVPMMPGRLVEPTDAFSTALAEVDDKESLDQLQNELATLCNMVLVADKSVIEGREDLARAVRKCSGYLGIGVRRMLDDKGHDERNAREVLLRYPLADIFRTGYGLAMELKWRALRIRRSGWFSSRGLGLGFWGEHWLGVLGGLLAPRPRFFDNFETGDMMYREFSSMRDIARTNAVLDGVRSADTLLGRCGFTEEELGLPNLTWKSLLLTHWAKDEVGPPEPDAPLSPAGLKTFFESLWTRDTPRRTRRERKQSFLEWLGVRCDCRGSALDDLAGPIPDLLFEELESEYSEVAPEHLDSRYILMFSVKPAKT